MRRALTYAATVAVLALSASPAAARDSSGSMSDAEIYAATCGHLGVPCSDGHGKRHHARSAKVKRRHARARARSRHAAR